MDNAQTCLFWAGFGNKISSSNIEIMKIRRYDNDNMSGSRYRYDNDISRTLSPTYAWQKKKVLALLAYWGTLHCGTIRISVRIAIFRPQYIVHTTPKI